jgi:alpha-L-rhamnosidase
MKNNNDLWLKSNARWISLAGSEEMTNLYLHFRKAFTLDKPVDLTIYITAYSQYELHINGTAAGRGPAVSYKRYYYYDKCRVSKDILNPGENIITVQLFHDGKKTEIVQAFDYGEPGLLFMADDGENKIVSDSSWKVRIAPNYTREPAMGSFGGSLLISRWGFYKELYNGDREDNWHNLDYDDSGWQKALETADAIDDNYAQNLVELELPPLQVTPVKPRRIIDAADNLGIMDFGGDIIPCEYTGAAMTAYSGEKGCCPSVTFEFAAMQVGYPEIRLKGGFCIYELWYGESLDLYRLDVVRNSSHGRWKAYQRRAFKYLQIKFIALEGPVEIEDITLHNTWYAYDESGYALCSDDKYQRILDVSKHTLRTNTSYHYEDCPWREQALWIFDMRVMALINYYFYGDTRLVAKNLRQCFAMQRENGAVNSTGPKMNNCYHLDFCMHLIGALREYYQVSGDRHLLLELEPYIVKLTGYIAGYVDQGVLDSSTVDGSSHVFLDWSNDIDKAGKSVILNAVYAIYLNDISVIYDVLGKNTSEFASSSDVLKKAVNELLFDNSAGLYRDSFYKGSLSGKFSLQGNMAAVYGGFAGNEKTQAIIEKITDKEKFDPPFAPSFYLIIFEALHSAGRHDLIIDYINWYWSAMLDRGATTWWEVFNPNTPEWMYPHPYLGNVPTYQMDWIPVSTCHGWSGACGYTIPRHILGIDLMGIYENKISIKPGIKGFFDKFNYRVPVKDGYLHVIFEADRIDLPEKPAGIEVEILS